MTAAPCSLPRHWRLMPLVLAAAQFTMKSRDLREGATMDWDRVSGDWELWKERIRDRWGRLTDDHLDVIAGRRELLAGRIGEVYGISREEAERQLRNWERNLGLDEFDEADMVLDDDLDTKGMDGRG
jgi:uncharacterized protein YjbJ (UPF0337 family)